MSMLNLINKSKDPSNTYIIAKPIVAGSIAGGLGYISTLPLDYVKQHIQSSNVGNRGVKSLLIDNVKNHGFKSLFKGGLIGCYSIVPQMAIKFSSNEVLKKKTNNSHWTNGFIAGYMDGSFLGPVLSIQSMQQMRNNYGYREAFNILKRTPILPMTFPLAFRNATYTSILFGGHKSLNWDSTFYNNFLATSMLNIPAVIACSPFDVVRARQIKALLDGKSNNPLTIARDIYGIRGVRGFYQGVGSLYINFALRFPLTFSIFYHLMNRFEKID